MPWFCGVVGSEFVENIRSLWGVRFGLYLRGAGKE